MPTYSDSLIFASNMRDSFGADLRLRDQVKRHELVRINRGQYFPAADWQTLGDDQKYEVRVLAAALSRSGPPPLSHYSSAVLWGLPLIGHWPEEVHFVTERRSGGRSSPGIRVHCTGFDAQDVTLHKGVLVTAAARTVIDLAAILEIKAAVAVIDRALAADKFGRRPPLTTKQELLATWQRMLPFNGSARALAFIQFGTHLSGSTGETSSRVNMALSGVPEPVLQQEFVVDGCAYDTDFFWPDYSAVGECDGDSKYSDPVLLAGRTPFDVMKAEKTREDRIRRQVSTFGRWDSRVALSRPRLRARLLELGLPTGRATLPLSLASR